MRATGTAFPEPRVAETAPAAYFHSTSRADGWTTACALSTAAVSLGYAIHAKNGNFSVESLLWLTVALASAVMAAWNGIHRRIELAAAMGLLRVLGIGLIFQIILLLTANPGTGLWVPLGPFCSLTWLAAGVVGLGFWRIPAARWALPLLLATHFFMGAWVIRHTPRPLIDVHVVQQAGCEELAHGHNPYAVRPVDIYGPDTHFYAPGTVKDGHLTVGCPYPPLSILLTLPSYMLTGDFRYAQLIAVTLAAALMALARGGRIGFAAAALYLLTPRGFFVLEQGWTEPFVVLMLAGTVFCACRFPRWTPLMLGLLLASKQYIFIAFPAALLLAPRPWLSMRFWRFWIVAAAVALAVTLPMALWDVHEFANSVLNIRDIFRVDSLSYLSAVALVTGWEPGGWVKYVALVPVIGLVLFKAPHTPSGFAASAGLLFLVLFAFAPHSAANYFFGCIGAMCCAVAATQPMMKPVRAPGRSGIPRIFIRTGASGQIGRFT